MSEQMDPTRCHKSELDTPALLLDLPTLDGNIRKMTDLLQGTGVGIRSHFKAHRTPEISRRQIAAGSLGVTCAKLGEAELLAEEGLNGFLIANEVVGAPKWRRLARLAERAEVMVGVDNPWVATEMGRHAVEVGSTVGVLVDVDSGMSRCGVPPGTPALDLARRVAETPGLQLRGVMTYEGHTVMESPDGKEAAIRAAVSQATESAALIRADGLPCPVVSAGGTGSFMATARCPGVTELQCGTYAVMDVLFREHAHAPFDYALSVLATVISRPTPGRAVTDGGKKALHPSFGMSPPRNLPGATLTALHSEHGILELEGAAQDLRVGALVEFIPYYVEGTMNLYDRVYVLQDERVVDVWAISGRGRSQ